MILKMQLGSLGVIDGAVSVEVVREIERTLGTTGGLSRRFGTQTQGIGDAAAVLFAMAKAADPESHPTMEQIESAVFEVGLLAASTYANELLSRAIVGAAEYAERESGDAVSEGADRELH